MNYQKYIDKYYPDDNELRRLLIHHSRQVAERALSVCDAMPQLGLDRELVEAGSMVHDIGIFLCDAPGIHCFGSAHYLYHGVLGARLMRSEGEEALARICERHTGTGLTAENFTRRGLEAPEGILMIPQTLEEQLICYADKFFSKSHPERTRTVEQTAESLRKYGPDGVEKFWHWAKLFENFERKTQK